MWRMSILKMHGIELKAVAKWDANTMRKEDSRGLARDGLSDKSQ